MTSPLFRPLASRPTSQVEVYLAHSDRHGAPLPADGRLGFHLGQVQDAVCALPGGGGCSTYQVDGYWPGSGRETTTVVRGSCYVGAWQGAVRLAAALASYQSECHQEVVGFTVDGRWYGRAD